MELALELDDQSSSDPVLFCQCYFYSNLILRLFTSSSTAAAAVAAAAAATPILLRRVNTTVRTPNSGTFGGWRMVRRAFSKHFSTGELLFWLNP